MKIDDYNICDCPPEGFGFIYKITSPSGKCYIGQTKRSLKRRLEKHNNKNEGCTFLNRSIKKHGIENFKIESLGIFLIELLSLAEIAAIKEYESVFPNGYNLTHGGEGGAKSEEAKRKMSLAAKGRKLSEEHRLKISAANKGRVVSKETRDKISKSHMGMRPSAETLIKMSKSRRGKINSLEMRAKLSSASKGPLNHMFGKKHTEESLRKMSIAHLGKRASAETKLKMSLARRGNKNHNFKGGG